jgi:hypothetical protein
MRTDRVGVNAHLEETGTHPFEVDAHLDETGTRPFEVDAHLDETGTRPFEVDAHLEETGTHPFEVDAHLDETGTRPFGVNAHLDETGTHPFEVNAHLDEMSTHPFGVNAHLGQIRSHPIGEHASQRGMRNDGAAKSGSALFFFDLPAGQGSDPDCGGARPAERDVLDLYAIAAQPHVCAATSQSAAVVRLAGQGSTARVALRRLADLEKHFVRCGHA